LLSVRNVEQSLNFTGSDVFAVRYNSVSNGGTFRPSELFHSTIRNYCR